MTKKHHIPEQIIRKRRKVERLTVEGSTVEEAVRQIEGGEQGSTVGRNITDV